MTEPIKGKDMANRFPIVAKAVSGLLEKDRNSYLLLVMGKMQGDAWGKERNLDCLPPSVSLFYNDVLTVPDPIATLGRELPTPKKAI